MQRYDLFSAGGGHPDLDQGGYEALRERVLATARYQDLSDEDRERLRYGVIAFSSGAGHDVGDVSRGDWQEIDAALDSGNVEDLEIALDRVGEGPYGWGEAPLVDEVVTDEEEPVLDDDGDLDPDAELDAAEAAAAAAGDVGWVGL